MNIKNVLVGVVCVLLLTAAAPSAQAFGETNRYLIHSSSAITRKALGTVRNDFGTSFSADLSGFQLRIARLLKVDVSRISTLEISSLSTNAQREPESIVPAARVSTPVTVALLDTGIAMHPQLIAAVADCKDFTQTKPLTDTCSDQNGHGTHAAGIIAQHARLLVYKVCNAAGVCYADDVAAAIRFAIDHHASIINMGFGSDTPSLLVADALHAAESQGVLAIAAAGNDGPFSDSIEYPAAYPDVVAVGAAGQDGTLADWSSRGNKDRDLDIIAPGEQIKSTWLDGGYATLSGTSMASAFVSGLAAQIWSQLLLRTHDGSAQVTPQGFAPLVREALRTALP